MQECMPLALFLITPIPLNPIDHPGAVHVDRRFLFDMEAANRIA